MARSGNAYEARPGARTEERRNVEAGGRNDIVPMIPANGAPHDLEARRASQFVVRAAPSCAATHNRHHPRTGDMIALQYSWREPLVRA
jgi:hypothetical protein